LLSRLASYLPTAVIAGLVVYFGVQALSGDRGLLHAHQRHVQLAQARAELARVHARRMVMENHARLLRNDSLSADLLEERARALLGFADPSDYVIRMPAAAG
jgi:cell division protein FtsB